jgi:hypothetical protein
MLTWCNHMPMRGEPVTEMLTEHIVQIRCDKCPAALMSTCGPNAKGA